MHCKGREESRGVNAPFVHLVLRRVLFVLVASALFFPPSVWGDSGDDRPEIPFLNYDDFKDLLGGTYLDVWNNHWKETDKAVYAGAVKEEIESDLAGVKKRYEGFKSWTLPPVLAAVKINPKNHLIYFLLEPGDELHNDADIVYIYDPGLKRFVCKTTVSLMQ